MAYRTASRRVNYRSDYTMHYGVSGTSAYVPARVATGKTKVRRKKYYSTVEQNRRRAMSFGRTYVIFLAFISIASVYMCVHYLQLREQLTETVRKNERLERQLLSARSENDALLQSAQNSVDWNHIRDVAIHELGMKYATEDQIVWYNTEDSYYVRQYSDVNIE